MTYQPIENYGIIGDMHTVALVGTDGSIDWLCVPDFDSPSVFAAILDDGKGGCFKIAPVGDDVTCKQFYWPDTNVLITRFLGPHGAAELADFMPAGRAVSGDRHCLQLVRRITAVRGILRFRMECRPAFNYARDAHTATLMVGGATLASASLILGLATEQPLETINGAVVSEFTLSEGEAAVFVLRHLSQELGCGISMSVDEAEELFRRTVQFWQRWMYAGRWREIVHRSALALKLLTYEPTGAIIAAPTCSLPEGIGRGRNWDYRYTWIRDSAFMLRSLYELGFGWEAIEYFGFIIDAVSSGDRDGPFELQVMYGIGGERELTERTLDHLSGWRGSRPVRVGNGAWNQRQHDVWGMILDAVDVQFRRNASQIEMPLWEGLAGFVQAALEHWREPDQGLWEVRGEPKHFTASKVMCWVAASRGADLARQRGDERAGQWQAGAEEIRAEVLQKGVSERGVFRQHYETGDLDASLLLLVLMGFLPPGDERMRATVLAIAGELTKDDLVLRYRVEGTDTGFSGEEGTFTICSFWLVSALAMIGETDRARALCQKLLSFAGPLLLYAEEIDTTTGEHLGNFPQAFTHLALIEAVSLLIASQLAEDVKSAGWDPAASTQVRSG